MPRINVDPNNIVCPDYTSPDHAALRQPLVDNGSTHDVAAQLLTAIWNTQHTIDCQRWQAQVDADTAAENARRTQHEEERKRLEEEAEKERAESKKEERKKNKAKYAPIPNRPIPSQQPVIASVSALKKLAKGEYVPLWYWTPAGIEAARSSFINSDTQTFTFVKDDHGSTTLAPTVSERESNSVIPDSNLPFDDFLIAIPRMIEAMGQAQWPKDRILMMSRFWDNILDNPRRSTGLLEDKLTLMVYQEEQRKQWHHATSVPGQGYDLSEISATLLESTESRLLRERRQKDDEAHKAMVSTFSLYNIQLSNNSPPKFYS